MYLLNKEMFYHKIFLETFEDIQKFAIEDIYSQNKFDNSNQLQIKHTLPINLRKKINLELKKYEIPNILYCQSYLRKKNTKQEIHIDGNNFIISSAINLPLKGYKDSYQIWYSGLYEKKQTNFNNIVYYKLFWKEKPKEIEKLEIDQPYLIRVDEPHSAFASINEDRWVFTMRFENNPNFDDLVKRLK